MITLEQLTMLTGRLQEELDRLRVQGKTDDPMAQAPRWALFVTPSELNGLLDEAEEAGLLKDVPPNQKQGMREGRGLWHHNGVMILPELMEPGEKLSG